ncbi:MULTISPECIES: alpha/beta fold hydrolase [Saccharothrix]|uniref:alpha/beta fold hydrolase n=1 Tax=Saccharothrix TaxID=2071 RepID=UPI00093F0393|nr:alpha/beta hydrolase [Saccharothrix sp. CB00851]OKI18512.1 alpha/beta hydrolase [Saccharothrix sp. CB00851]
MAECPTPDDVVDVETRHGTTRVYRFGGGDAPPIVLLPGLMATSACYAHLIPAFAAHHPVYTVDTLGEAGRSVRTAPLRDIPDRARCLDDVLDRLRLTDVHLVGASTGGWHALNQAIHAPDRIASISLLDPTTVTAPFRPWVALVGLVGGVLDQEWPWRLFLRRSAGADVASRPDARLVLTALRTYRPRVPFQTRPGDDRIRSVRLPVLAVFGARSVVQDSVAAADRLRALLPHADVDTLPDAGHDVTLRPEDRDHVVERVLDFVSRTSA